MLPVNYVWDSKATTCLKTVDGVCCKLCLPGQTPSLLWQVNFKEIIGSPTSQGDLAPSRVKDNIGFQTFVPLSNLFSCPPCLQENSMLVTRRAALSRDRKQE